ncbi:MAG: hypothetical protein L6R38_008956 [Xanthoria sp. 2 TBL-2021]|nr:MAG: hypothetical protein L6R38_008956 [Xanthoria sp. 2 TBL-2021]
MDSVRNAMGYGAQSGQEPLSGQTGQGTVDDPYDSGNVAGQSGAPSSNATSTNPAGTTQFDTGADAQGNTIGYGPGTTQFDSGTDTKGNTSGFGAANDDTNTSQYPIGDNNTTTTASETLAAGVTGDSNGPADARADNQPLGTSTAGDTSRAAAGDTSGAAHKGTDETRGADEQVTSEQSRPTSDNNANAQDTFFANAGMSKDKPADPPKVASEVADKDPFASSGGAPSNDTANEPSGQFAAPSSSNTTSGAVGGTSLDKISSTAPDKNYKTVDTEPHPQSSEVLSSATPGAALDSQTRSQTSGYDNSTTAATGVSGYGNDSTPDTSASIHDNTTTTMKDRSGYGNEPTTTTTTSGYDNTPNTTTTTAAAADTDYPSPKTQPTESAGGLAGVSHNTGSAPSAPDTGVSDSSLQQAASQAADEGGSHGEGKKKMSDKIKEKLHMGKK